MSSTEWHDRSDDLREGYELKIGAAHGRVWRTRNNTAGYSAEIVEARGPRQARELFRTPDEAKAWCERELAALAAQ
jgi:hypothetical protein